MLTEFEDIKNEVLSSFPLAIRDGMVSGQIAEAIANQICQDRIFMKALLTRIEALEARESQND